MICVVIWPPHNHQFQSLKLCIEGHQFGVVAEHHAWFFSENRKFHKMILPIWLSRSKDVMRTTFETTKPWRLVKTISIEPTYIWDQRHYTSEFPVCFEGCPQRWTFIEDMVRCYTAQVLRMQVMQSKNEEQSISLSSHIKNYEFQLFSHQTS